MRISPDGARIAYDQVIDGDPTTLWTPAAATGLDFPGQADGQAVPGRAVVDRQRRAAAEPRRRVRRTRARRSRCYGIGGADGSGGPVVQRRRGDLGDRLRRRRLALRDADRGARGRRRRPRRDARRASSCGSSPPTRPAPRRRSAASSRSRPTDTYSSASPTFSPDGTRLAWAAERRHPRRDARRPGRLRRDPRAGRDAPGRLGALLDARRRPPAPSRARQARAPLTLTVQHPRPPAPRDAAQARPAGAGHGQRAGDASGSRCGSAGKKRFAARRDPPRVGRRHDDRLDPPAPARPAVAPSA